MSDREMIAGNRAEVSRGLTCADVSSILHTRLVRKPAVCDKLLLCVFSALIIIVAVLAARSI